MKEIEISWLQFHEDCRKLAQQIQQSGETFTTMIVITRGGLCVGGVLSQFLNIKDIRTICLESYKDHKEQPLRIVHTPDLYRLFGERILVVDDVLDSGHQLKWVQNFLGEHQLFYKTATLYCKHPRISPNYHVSYYPYSLWVKFPWEIKDD